jgi:hypothetical protein
LSHKDKSHYVEDRPNMFQTVDEWLSEYGLAT